MYRTGTQGKITKNRLLRNCLKARSYEGISPEAVPLTENSTRMRIRKISFGNGQRFKKYFCQDYKNVQLVFKCYRHGVICKYAFYRGK